MVHWPAAYPRVLSLSVFPIWPAFGNGLAFGPLSDDTTCSRTPSHRICWLPQRNHPPSLSTYTTESCINLCSSAIQRFVFCLSPSGTPAYHVLPVSHLQEHLNSLFMFAHGLEIAYTLKVFFLFIQ